MKTLPKKTDAREHLISQDIIEPGDRLRKETMEAIAADPVLSAEMNTIRENAEANIRRASKKESWPSGRSHSYAGVRRARHCSF